MWPAEDQRFEPQWWQSSVAVSQLFLLAASRKHHNLLGKLPLTNVDDSKQRKCDLFFG
jgi:hypothetical protein